MKLILALLLCCAPAFADASWRIGARPLQPAVLEPASPFGLDLHKWFPAAIKEQHNLRFSPSAAGDYELPDADGMSC